VSLVDEGDVAVGHAGAGAALALAALARDLPELFLVLLVCKGKNERKRNEKTRHFYVGSVLSLMHSQGTRKKGVAFAYLELRPVHGHVDAVVVGPPPQVLLVVRVVHCVVELLVDLRQAAEKMTSVILVSDCQFHIGGQGDLKLGRTSGTMDE